MRQLLSVLYVVAILVFVLGCYFFTLREYEALKKFYPDLTYSDYLILGDKLRITPGVGSE